MKLVKIQKIPSLETYYILVNEDKILCDIRTPIFLGLTKYTYEKCYFATVEVFIKEVPWIVEMLKNYKMTFINHNFDVHDVVFEFNTFDEIPEKFPEYYI